MSTPYVHACVSVALTCGIALLCNVCSATRNGHLTLSCAGFWRNRCVLSILLWMFTALRTEPFDHKRNRMRLETIRQRNRRNLLILQAIWLVTGFTIEMNMSVGMIAGAVMTAEFIIYHTAAVLECMDNIMLQKYWHHSEYARLVHIWHGILQSGQTHRLMHIMQSLENQNPVGSCLHALVLQQFYDIRTVHYIICFRNYSRHLLIESPFSSFGSIWTSLPGPSYMTLAFLSICVVPVFTLYKNNKIIRNIFDSADLQVCRWFLIQSVNVSLNIGLFRYKVVDNDWNQLMRTWKIIKQSWIFNVLLLCYHVASIVFVNWHG